MYKQIITAVITLLFTTQSFAFIDSLKKMVSGDDDNKSSLVSSVTGNSDQISGLTSLLTSNLPVSDQQATTGTGALLALASSQLSSENNSELQSLVPGMSQLSGSSNLLGNIQSLDAVQSVFENIGLDSSMVSQFAPLLLKYLSTSGASDGLLSSLTGLWGS